ncbi:MAG: hypothetical protein WBD25_15710 [Terriglobales bacterium]
MSKLVALAGLVALTAIEFAACSGNGQVQAPEITVGVTTVARKSLGRQITLSS